MPVKQHTLKSSNCAQAAKSLQILTVRLPNYKRVADAVIHCLTKYLLLFYYKNNLALVLLCLHVLMCLPGFRQLEFLVNDRFELASLKLVSSKLCELRHNLLLVSPGPRAHCTANDLQSLAKYLHAAHVHAEDAEERRRELKAEAAIRQGQHTLAHFKALRIQ